MSIVVALPDPNECHFCQKRHRYQHHPRHHLHRHDAVENRYVSLRHSVKDPSQPRSCPGMAKGKKGGKKDKGDKADGVPPPAQVKTGIDKLSAEQKVKTDGKCNGMVYDDQVD